jgi:hypothetical protein
MEANRASSYAYSRNPPAEEKTEEKKQHTQCTLGSSVNHNCCVFFIIINWIVWQKITEGIKSDNQFSHIFT